MPKYKYFPTSQKCMKKLHERGNGEESEDVGSDSNSSDKGGSNQVPILPNTLVRILSLPRTFGYSVLTSFVCSNSFPLPYITKVAQQPNLTFVQRMTIEQQEACSKALACAFCACNIPFAVVETVANFITYSPSLRGCRGSYYPQKHSCCVFQLC